MTRYQVLRGIGCSRFVAWFIATMNSLRGVPEGEIRFLNVTMEYEP